MKKCIVALLVFFVLLFLSACGSSGQISGSPDLSGFHYVFNEDGEYLWLGMPRDDVGENIFIQGGAHISFDDNDRISHINVSSDRWLAPGGFTLGATIDEIEQVFELEYFNSSERSSFFISEFTYDHTPVIPWGSGNTFYHIFFSIATESQELESFIFSVTYQPASLLDPDPLSLLDLDLDGFHFVYNEAGDYIWLSMSREEVEATGLFEAGSDSDVLTLSMSGLGITFDSNDRVSIITVGPSPGWFLRGGLASGSDWNDIETIFDMNYVGIPQRASTVLEWRWFSFAYDHTPVDRRSENARYSVAFTRFNDEEQISSVIIRLID